MYCKVFLSLELQWALNLFNLWLMWNYICSSSAFPFPSITNPFYHLPLSFPTFQFVYIDLSKFIVSAIFLSSFHHNLARFLYEFSFPFFLLLRILLFTMQFILSEAIFFGLLVHLHQKRFIIFHILTFLDLIENS